MTLTKAVRTISSVCVSKWLTCLSRFFETLQAVQELKSGHEIANGLTDEHRGYNILRTLPAYSPVRDVFSHLNCFNSIFVTGSKNKRVPSTKESFGVWWVVAGKNRRDKKLFPDFGMIRKKKDACEIRYTSEWSKSTRSLKKLLQCRKHEDKWWQ